jgi:maleate cis-trans isomerase
VNSTKRAPVIGLLYPGFSAEDDFPLLERRLAGRLRLPLVHTSVGLDAHAVEALLDLGSTERLATGADDLAPHDPDAVIWACTSGSFVFGWDGARRQVDELAERIGRPVSSTSIAFVNAARSLGLHRVAVAASYPADVAGAFETFLRHGDIGVTALRSHDIFTAAAVGELSPDQVIALVAAVDASDADAVLVPDTAMHTIGVLDRLESVVNKPVLTANQVSVWEGLRLVGGSSLIEEFADAGLGRLFRGAARSAP